MLTVGPSGFTGFDRSNISATWSAPIKIKGDGAELDVAPYANVTLSLSNPKVVGAGVIAAVGAGEGSVPVILAIALETLKALGGGALDPVW